MKRNLLKITTLLLVILAITFTMTTPVFATGDSLAGDEGFNVTFNVSDSTNAGNVVANVVGNLLYIAQVIGMGVATIMLLVLAIKYIAASPNDKAEIKKHIVVYVVGAVILFSASGLLAIIRRFALGVKKTAEQDPVEAPAATTDSGE